MKLRPSTSTLLALAVIALGPSLSKAAALTCPKRITITVNSLEFVAPDANEDADTKATILDFQRRLDVLKVLNLSVYDRVSADESSCRYRKQDDGTVDGKFAAVITPAEQGPLLQVTRPVEMLHSFGLLTIKVPLTALSENEIQAGPKTATLYLSGLTPADKPASRQIARGTALLKKQEYP